MSPDGPTLWTSSLTSTTNLVDSDPAGEPNTIEGLSLAAVFAIVGLLAVVAQYIVAKRRRRLFADPDTGSERERSSDDADHNEH